MLGRVEFVSEDRIRLAPNSHESRAAEEFALAAPVRGVFVGDEVRVHYRLEDGRKIAVQIEELFSRQ